MRWGTPALTGYAAGAGFKGDALATAVAIALAASGGDDTLVVEPFPGALSGRVGLYGIPRHYLTDDAAAGPGDPVRASRTAFLLTVSSGEGFDWSPEYTSGRYARHLDHAVEVVASGQRVDQRAAYYVVLP